VKKAQKHPSRGDLHGSMKILWHIRAVSCLRKSASRQYA